jgi:NADPH:quinone reductase-like Zn-dependent oxidoreductase
VTTAIVFSTYGDPDVLEAIDVEEPQPGAGQVGVRVKVVLTIS